MIRIKSGTCGTSQGYMTPSSGELSLPAPEEARLVARGVADYVTRPVIGDSDAVATPPGGSDDGEAGVDQPDNADTAGGQGNGEEGGTALCIVDGHLTVESLMTMTRAEMEKLAEDLGVDIKKCKNKTEIAALLSAVEVEPGEPCTEDGEDLPNLGAEDPVT